MNENSEYYLYVLNKEENEVWEQTVEPLRWLLANIYLEYGFLSYQQKTFGGGKMAQPVKFLA